MPRYHGAGHRTMRDVTGSVPAGICWSRKTTPRSWFLLTSGSTRDGAYPALQSRVEDALHMSHCFGGSACLESAHYMLEVIRLYQSSVLANGRETPDARQAVTQRHFDAVSSRNRHPGILDDRRHCCIMQWHGRPNLVRGSNRCNLTGNRRG